MPEEIAVLLAMLTLGGLTLAGLRMFLTYRVKRFSISSSGGDTEAGHRLEEAVNGLKDEVYLLRNDMSDLAERVDFAERLLAQAREEKQLGK